MAWPSAFRWLPASQRNQLLGQSVGETQKESQFLRDLARHELAIQFQRERPYLRAIPHPTKWRSQSDDHTSAATSLLSWFPQCCKQKASKLTPPRLSPCLLWPSLHCLNSQIPQTIRQAIHHFEEQQRRDWQVCRALDWRQCCNMGFHEAVNQWQFLISNLWNTNGWSWHLWIPWRHDWRAVQ